MYGVVNCFGNKLLLSTSLDHLVLSDPFDFFDSTAKPERILFAKGKVSEESDDLVFILLGRNSSVQLPHHYCIVGDPDQLGDLDLGEAQIEPASANMISNGGEFLWILGTRRLGDCEFAWGQKGNASTALRTRRSPS